MIGTAFALNILFNIPVWSGVLITGLSTLLLLGLQRYGVINSLIISYIIIYQIKLQSYHLQDHAVLIPNAVLILTKERPYSYFSPSTSRETISFGQNESYNIIAATSKG